MKLKESKMVTPSDWAFNSASELGLDAPPVEENLRRIFEMTADWNTGLLIDKADVFLEARIT